jgi:hypothetical protein
MSCTAARKIRLLSLTGYNVAFFAIGRYGNATQPRKRKDLLAQPTCIASCLHNAIAIITSFNLGRVITLLASLFEKKVSVMICSSLVV